VVFRVAGRPDGLVLVALEDGRPLLAGWRLVAIVEHRDSGPVLRRGQRRGHTAASRGVRDGPGARIVGWSVGARERSWSCTRTAARFGRSGLGACGTSPAPGGCGRRAGVPTSSRVIRAHGWHARTPSSSGVRRAIDAIDAIDAIRAPGPLDGRERGLMRALLAAYRQRRVRSRYQGRVGEWIEMVVLIEDVDERASRRYGMVRRCGGRPRARRLRAGEVVQLRGRVARHTQLRRQTDHHPHGLPRQIARPERSTRGSILYLTNRPGEKKGALRPDQTVGGPAPLSWAGRAPGA
jgi:hypothetical protein